ncbi:2-dehydropantoate 2-reductase [Spongiibacter taiwanensis]|uniref:2-dehydropantoate 2-reductase n=1 Tax=Spongiibacter taiwanensis TaxID=1748242 RepID=UPI00203519F4|nr:2-dehydropantoate 2-reductase [Spongiibacter taiwanensis]USA44147.1 2-dehydropantoate 2-reductase [Spongiibacter taiwanensis]
MTTRVAVIGAGSIGCFIGGVLQMAGASVRLHGRRRLDDELAEHGLTLTDYRGLHHHLPAVALDYRQNIDALDEAGLILVAVKSGDTRAIADQLRPCLREDAVIISLQNGVSNAEILQAHLPGHRVLAGTVTFNVLQLGQGRFHAGTEGMVVVEDAPESRELAPLFAVSGTVFETSQNMTGLLWSKLLLNLNNPINALSGLPLREELAQRDFRRCLALLQQEALAALARSEIKLPRINGLPPTWLPGLLRLPNVVFTLLARKMLAIDPMARSSMWEDLQRGRKTEIDALCGAVSALAQSVGLSAAANRRMTALVNEAEQGKVKAIRDRTLLRKLSHR